MVTNMVTDLEKVKEVARVFAHLEVKPESLDLFVSHPFTDTAVMCGLNNNFINILNSEDDHQEFLEICMQRIESTHSYSLFSAVITKPYRSVFFKMTEQYVSLEDGADFLKSLWLSTETVNIDVNISRFQYIRYFKKYKEYLMEPEEQAVYDDLKAEIIVYRGVNLATNHPIDGLSWTPNIKKAEFFAKRFGEGGVIYQAKIKKQDILVYFSYEEETVVDYRKLQHLESIITFKAEKEQ